MVARRCGRGRGDLLSMYSSAFLSLGRVEPSWLMVCLLSGTEPPSLQIPAVIELSLFVTAMVRHR